MTRENDQQTMPRWSRRRLAFLAVILVVALALRLWYLGVNQLYPQFSNSDDGDYYYRALRLAVTGRYVDDAWLIRPPFHIFIFAGLLKIGMALGGPSKGVALIQLFHVLIGVAQVAMAADIARRLWRSERAGLVLGAALAVFWPLVELPATLFSEPLYLFLWTLHLWLLARFDASGRRLTLLAAGLVLGCAALTRSPALYSLAFTAPWLLMRAWRGRRPAAALRIAALQLALLTATTLAVVLPWTARNYVVYKRFIPIDTLGPINLWLDLDTPETRTEKIELLRDVPQADRQAYASARAREILAADPDPLLRNTLLRSAWPNFRHIWKAYYLEDYVVKRSFFSRPLDQVRGLGLLSDVLWLAIVLGAAAGVWAPALTHRWRALLLMWLGYTLLTVLVFHIEPRYLMPIWISAAWLAAGVLARPLQLGRRLLRRPALAAAAGLSLVAILWLTLSYRDYPAMITTMLRRDQHWTAARQAYNDGDYATAAEQYRQALVASPGHDDLRIGLGMALAAQGKVEEARQIVDGLTTRRGEALQAFLLLQTDQRDAGMRIWGEAERIAGEDIQAWILESLPQRRSSVDLGNGNDLGLVSGFAGSEQLNGRTFRWSSEQARIVLHPERPIERGATIELDLAAPGRPEQQTPVELSINGSTIELMVQPDWRQYRLTLPAELEGATVLDIRLTTPAFIPALQSPQNNDNRVLGVMVGTAVVHQEH